MTKIVFLIDTSASMNQRAYLGGRPKLLDIAKGAVETFVKVREIFNGILRCVYGMEICVMGGRTETKQIHIFFFTYRPSEETLQFFELFYLCI